MHVTCPALCLFLLRMKVACCALLRAQLDRLCVHCCLQNMSSSEDTGTPGSQETSSLQKGLIGTAGSGPPTDEIQKQLSARTRQYRLFFDNLFIMFLIFIGFENRVF